MGCTPLLILCVQERSRCGSVRISNFAGQPSAGTLRVGALSLWRRANSEARRRTLCGFRASGRSLRRRANFRRGLRTLSLFSKGARAGVGLEPTTLSQFCANGSAVEIFFGIDDPLPVFGAQQRWRVEGPENSVWNGRSSRCFLRVAALAREAS